MTDTRAERGAAWQRFLPDPFLLALLAVVGLAIVLPCRGDVQLNLRRLANLMIAFLFFAYGLRLAPSIVADGMAKWRLQSGILGCTFIFFPLCGFLLQRLWPTLLPEVLWTGLLFLCLLPSTVQASVSFTSMARGDTAAAVCAATLSNLAGVVVTPVFMALLLRSRGADIGAAQALKVMMQLVLPFLAGQMLRPRLAAWAHRNSRPLLVSDRSAILLSVYTAFSAAMVQGLWARVPSRQLWALGAICAALLVVVLATTVVASRLLGWSRSDEVVLVFCGSQKSLATGIPIANVMFSGAALGFAVLPLMIYHQLELVVGLLLARRYAREPEVARTRDVRSQA